jgi:hypothetical protein
METEKTKRIKRIVTVSLRGSEKKAEGKFIKAEAERKANPRERKRKNRAMTKERNELQKCIHFSIFTVFGRWNNSFFLQFFNSW